MRSENKQTNKISNLKGDNSVLLNACRNQHEAIDSLFAMLILKDSNFRPSESGQPWQALIQGNAAIERVTSLPGDSECPDLHGACRMALDFLRPPLYQDNPIPTEEEVVEKLRGVLGEND